MELAVTPFGREFRELPSLGIQVVGSTMYFGFESPSFLPNLKKTGVLYKTDTNFTPSADSCAGAFTVVTSSVSVDESVRNYDYCKWPYFIL